MSYLPSNTTMHCEKRCGIVYWQVLNNLKFSIFVFLYNPYLLIPYSTEYKPSQHIHVICPATKLNCFRGSGRCANNEVVLTIFKSARNGLLRPKSTSFIQLVLNKGCSCQMYDDFVFLGDGNT